MHGHLGWLWLGGWGDLSISTSAIYRKYNAWLGAGKG